MIELIIGLGCETVCGSDDPLIINEGTIASKKENLLCWRNWHKLSLNVSHPGKLVRRRIGAAHYSHARTSPADATFDETMGACNK